MIKGKDIKLYKIVLIFIITFVFIIQLNIESVTAGLPEDKPDEMNITEAYQEGRSEYVFYDISDRKDDIPIYGEPKVKLFAINSSEDVFLYGYSTLTPVQKTLYDKIDTAFTTFMEVEYQVKDYTVGSDKFITLFQVQDTSSSNVNDLLKAYWAYRHDHPEYYWMSSYYSYFTTTPSVIITMDNSYAKASVRKECETLIKEGIQPYIEEALKYNDDYDKIRVVHDMIIDAADYAYNSSGRPESAIWAHNVIGLFSGRGVVCEGYSKAFQLILNQLKIKNVYVIGYAGEAHAWNYVCINGQYYALDLTWNDLGNKYPGCGGLMYQYFCMPGSYFKASHSAYTTAGDPKDGKWLYTLPALQEGNECTYYYKYKALASGISNSTSAEAFVAEARYKAQGDYVRILADSSSINYIASALGVSSYITVSNYGSYKALFIAENYKADNPAESMILSAESLEIDRSVQTEDIYLEVTLNEGSACDDRISWTSSSSVVQISGSGTRVKLIPKRNGTAEITVKAAVSKKSVTCTVTVTGGPDSDNIYLDTGYTQGISEGDIVIWVNGGSVKTGNGNEKINYKQAVMYTDITASKIVTSRNGRVSTKNGKLIVGVTLSSAEPELVKGRIVDAEAAKIAKASIKNGVITVKAQKQAGTVYVWVYDTGDDNLMGCAPITVKTAPSKITITEAESDTTAFKKIIMPVNTSDMLYLVPTIDKNGTVTKDASYTVKPGTGYEDYIQIIKQGDNSFQFTALGLKNNKTTTVKLTASCDQNSKKAILSVAINNPVRSISPAVTAASAALFTKKSDTITIALNETTYMANYNTTMKPSIYIMTEPDLTLDSKNRLQGVKANGITAKLAGDKKSFTLTLTKEPDVILGNQHIYAIYKEGYEYKLFYIGYIEKSSLTFISNNLET